MIESVLESHVAFSRKDIFPCGLKEGCITSCTQEIFTVRKIILRVPPVYRLRDYADNEIEGVFYAEELQKVQSPMTFTK